MEKEGIIKKLIGIILIIYVIFLFTDIGFRNTGNLYSTMLKFSSIVLCFLVVVLIGNDAVDNKDKFLVQLARFFTVLADLFMVVLDCFELGVGCFCIVQFIYIIRHSRGMNFIKTIARLLITILIFSLIYLKVPIPNLSKSMYIIALLYASLLINSVIMAVTTFKRKFYTRISRLLIAIGMVLFFMCDLNVGLFNLIQFYEVEFIRINNLEFLVGFLVWFFYLPSQLILSLSGFRQDYLKRLFG